MDLPMWNKCNITAAEVTTMIGRLKKIYTSPGAGEPMISQHEVLAIAGAGLQNDRYAIGTGSYVNKEKPGRRQVTLISAEDLAAVNYPAEFSRRNLVTEGVDLMWLLGRPFVIGDVQFRGVAYCDPCARPSNLGRTGQHDLPDFGKVMMGRGGLIAEVMTSGMLRVGIEIPKPPRKPSFRPVFE